MQLSDLRPIEPITREHNRKGFSSGTRSLDNYLWDRAVGDTEKNLSRVFVLTLRDAPSAIVGYYSLSSLQVPTEGLPAELTKKFGYKIVPTTLLGKLAVGEDWQRDKRALRLGEYLLIHAMQSTWIAAQSVASWAMVVDVLVGEKGDPTVFFTKKVSSLFRTNRTSYFCQ